MKRARWRSTTPSSGRARPKAIPARSQLPPGKVLPWLYGIATNVVRNRRRSERRHRAALARMPAPDAEPSFDAEAVARLDDERRMRHALELLAALPRQQQDVLVLCDWSELSYEDAAFALSVPIGTVRSRLSRARRALEELAPPAGHEQAECLEGTTRP